MLKVGDHYIGVDILLPRGDKMARGHIVGYVMGRTHSNPILDTRMYQVEFAGGKVTELTTNIITESTYTQCNTDGNEYFLLNLLFDHHKDNKAISLPEQQISIWGRPITCKTTEGWQICCQWKDYSTSGKVIWVEKCHPVQTAEFAISQGIYHKPAFNCWVNHILKKRNRIIVRDKKQQTRYLNRSQ